MSSNSMWTLTLILLVALFGFVPSINALSVDWKADKHPTHTLDHITAVLSGGSGDPSKVNVVLYTYNQYTGQSYNIPIASNVGNTGSYTVQVPNHYIGDIPSGKTESQYFAQDLRYRTQALNPSNNQAIGQSADFVIFWNPDDGTSTPTKFSTTSSSGSSSSGSGSSSSSNSNSGSQSSSSSSNDNSNKSSGSSSSNNNNNGSDKSPSSDSTNKDTSQGVSSITGTATVIGALADSTSIFTSTAPAVTVSGVLIPGKTATVTSVLPGTTHSISGNASSDKSMTGAIVGAVVGGLVALALLGWLAVWCCRRRRIARRPTAGQALSQPQRLPEAGIITPAIWANRGEDDREERATTVGTMLEKQVDLEAGRNSPLEDEKVAPSIMLTGDFPILNRRLSGETLSGDDDHAEKGQASPTSSASNYPVPVSSTRTSWLTAGQGSFSEPFTPPPEYSRRQTTRSSTGAIDAVLANIA